MQLPIQIVFRNMERSESIEDRVRERAKKLESFCDRIISCRVVIELPHRHHVHGNKFLVRVDITVPDKEIVVNRESQAHEAYADIDAALRDAFESARRHLEDYVRRRRHHVKEHSHSPTGRITQLLPEKDHGFITTPNGREIYFHANAIINRDFDQLKLGSEVTFTEEQADKGPNASSLKVVREPVVESSLQVISTES